MEKTFEMKLSAKEKAELISQFDQYLEEMRRIQEQMKKDRSEIDRIKTETWAILDQLRKAA